jgi:hypothetical protein
MGQLYGPPLYIHTSPECPLGGDTTVSDQHWRTILNDSSKLCNSWFLFTSQSSHFWKCCTPSIFRESTVFLVMVLSTQEECFYFTMKFQLFLWNKVHSTRHFIRRFCRDSLFGSLLHLSLKHKMKTWHFRMVEKFKPDILLEGLNNFSLSTSDICLEQMVQNLLCYMCLSCT